MHERKYLFYGSMPISTIRFLHRKYYISNLSVNKFFRTQENPLKIFDTLFEATFYKS